MSSKATINVSFLPRLDYPCLPTDDHVKELCYVMLSLETTFYLHDKKLENVDINNFKVFSTFNLSA